MIASLRGILSDKSAGTCTIEAGGVGYLVFVSAHTWSSLPERGGAVYLRTRQIVREDALQLFGFGDTEELRLFDLLIAVSGVGPRLALALLSGLRPQALARAIRDEQVGALVAVPGIGRKTAERLIVELRDKLETGPGAGAGGALSRAPSGIRMPSPRSPVSVTLRPRRRKRSARSRRAPRTSRWRNWFARPWRRWARPPRCPAEESH